jgi:predicted dehydrogenase
VRLGIVGCGLIGRKRAAVARALGHEVVAVADTANERALSLAVEAGARAVEDWQEIPGTAGVDAVVVATSHDWLSPIAVACLDQRKHVLVEKPGGRDLAGVAAIAEAARRNGRVAKIGFNHRFHPGLIAAKELVTGGALGPLYYIRGRYGHGGRVGYEKEWRCNRAISGGGELIDQGVHLIDLSRWMLGELSFEYGAVPTYFWNTKVEDNCFLALRGKQGEMAWLHATWTEWKNTFTFEIVGRDGKLTIDGLGGSYGTERLTFHKMLPAMGPPETTIWEYPFPDTSWDKEFASFAAAIAGKPSQIADIDDACEVFAIVGAAYKFAGTKNRPSGA